MPSKKADPFHWDARVRLTQWGVPAIRIGNLGLTEAGEHYGFSLALGSAEVTLVEQVAARLSEQGARVTITDGVRVSTDDGWWLLRASNTQDVLVARAEAKDEAGLDRLMAQIDAQLEASGLERGEQVGH